MRKLFPSVLLLFLPSFALAQLTTVTGTIKDPNGLPYANGTIVPTLVCSASPTLNGLPYSPPGTTGLSASGSFTMLLADVNQLRPPGCTWSFHVCSASGTVQPGSPITAGPVCFDAPGFIITGASQDIGASLSLAAPKLTSGVGAGAGGTVGAGTAGQFAIYNAPTGVVGTPTLTTDGSTVNTTTVPFGCPLNSRCLQTSNGGFGFNTSGTPQVYNSSGAAGQVLAFRINNNVIAPSISSGILNINNATPAAPANGINLTWQLTNGAPSNLSAAIVGDGNSAHSLNGTGTFAQNSNSTFGGNCTGSTTTCTTSVVGTPSAFVVTPNCTATPTTNGVTSYFISSVTTNLIILTYAPSGTQTFSITCVGPGQP